MVGGESSSTQKIARTTKKIVTHKAFVTLLILIPIFFAIFFRAYPATLPITEDWAEQSVQNAYVQQAQQQLRQQFPYMSPQDLQARAQQTYRDFAEENPEAVDEQVTALRAQYKERLQLTLNKSNGEQYNQTYYLAIDPYYYLERTEDILDRGTVCEEVVDGECRDTQMLSPNGVRTSAEYHTYVEAGLAKIGTWFGFAPMTFPFFLPAIFAGLATIPAFLIVRRRYGSLGGFIAAMVVALHAAFLGRTPAGFVDTDVWNVFFPLTIAYLFLLGFDQKGWKGYSLMAAAGVLTGVYSKFWAGWYFTFFVLLAVLMGAAVYAGARLLVKARQGKLSKRHRQELAAYAINDLFLLGIFVIATGIVTSIVASPSTFLSAFTAPLQASLGLQDPINPSLWPNVHTTVAELNTVSVANIIGSLGGRVLFIAAILGIFGSLYDPEKMRWQEWTGMAAITVYYIALTSQQALAISGIAWVALLALPLAAALIHKLFSEQHLKIHYALYTMGWMVATVFATTQGTRFLLLLVPVYGIALGFFAEWIYRALAKPAEDHLQVPQFWAKVAVIAAVLLTLFAPVGANMVGNAHNIAKGEVPSMNDAWWASLKSIQHSSSDDAVITSWWDFGHWFKYVADRAVTFDGASQNTPQAHWVGYLLTTDNETEAVSILRMLDCGGNDAYEAINAELNDPLASYSLAREVISLPEDEARRVLEDRGIEPSQVLPNTHCAPPEAYLIVSEDMVGKSGVWAHFGLWDFERAFAAQAVREQDRATALAMIQERLGVNQGRAAQLYGEIRALPNRESLNAWVSPWPRFVGARSCAEDNQSVQCGLGIGVAQQQGVTIAADRLLIDRSSPENATITLSAQGQNVGTIRPSTLILDGDRYDIGGELPFAIAIENGMAVVAQEPLAQSLFAQLFYREDPGDFFTKISEQQQVSGGKIIVYKVDWEAYVEAAE